MISKAARNLNIAGDRSGSTLHVNHVNPVYFIPLN